MVRRFWLYLVFWLGVLTGVLIVEAGLAFQPASISPVRGAGSVPPAPLSIRTYKVTAYCPCEKCCGRFADGFTASGRAAEGFFVAAPPDIPFGTLLSIPGYNDGIPVPVLDRGNAINGNKLDVFFPTHKEALEWGVKYLEVRIERETK